MTSDPIQIIFSLAILLVSIIAHEVAHGLAADSQGDHTARFAGRLTLNPLPHIDLMGSIILPGLLFTLGSPVLFGWAKPVPVNFDYIRTTLGRVFVAAAGVLTNLGLAIVFGLLIRFGGDALPAAFLELANYGALINIVLAVFNSIPIPPLDGSKIIAPFLPPRFEGLIYEMEQFGFFLLIFFILFLWPMFSPLIELLYRIIVGA